MEVDSDIDVSLEYGVLLHQLGAPINKKPAGVPKKGAEKKPKGAMKKVNNATKKDVVKKDVVKKHTYAPGFKRQIDTKRGTLKMTYAKNQSYIHFYGNDGSKTYLLTRTVKHPDHAAYINKLAHKLAQLPRCKTGDAMKQAALDIRG